METICATMDWTAGALVGVAVPVTVTMKAAAEMSGLSIRTLQRLAAAGQLQTVKIGGRRLVKVASLHRLLGGGA